MSDRRDDRDSRPRLAAGTKVEVRAGLDGSWSAGFAVHDVTPSGYRLRRLSDGEVLPAEISTDQVRRERKSSMWWV